MVLEVASGPGQITVPGVQGMNAAQAAQRLIDLKLRVHQVQVQALARPGIIVSQSPAPGMRVTPESSITIKVSAGIAKVPAVLGQDINVARKLLAAYGFTDVAVVSRVSPGIPNGIVVSQNPLPGSLVLPGARIALSVVENQSSQTPDSAAKLCQIRGGTLVNGNCYPPGRNPG